MITKAQLKKDIHSYFFLCDIATINYLQKIGYADGGWDPTTDIYTYCYVVIGSGEVHAFSNTQDTPNNAKLINIDHLIDPVLPNKQLYKFNKEDL